MLQKSNVKNDENIKKLWSKGKTDSEIAEELNIARTTVCSARKRLGLPANRGRGKRGADRSHRNAGRISETIRKELLNILYSDPGISVAALARAAGLTSESSSKNEKRAAYAVIHRFLEKIPIELAKRRERIKNLKKVIIAAAREAKTTWIAAHGYRPGRVNLPRRQSEIPLLLLNQLMSIDQDYTHFKTFIHVKIAAKVIEYIYTLHEGEIKETLETLNKIPLKCCRLEPEQIERLYKKISAMLTKEAEEVSIDPELLEIFSSRVLSIAGARRRGRGGGKKRNIEQAQKMQAAYANQ